MPASARLSPSREAELLETVLGLVTELGLDRTTVDAVAARAGASKGTLYRRWSTKSEMVAEAIRRRGGISFELEDTGAFRSDLIAALGLIASWLHANAALLRALIEAGRRDPELRALTKSHLVDPHDAMWELVVGRAISRNEIRDDVDSAWVNELCEALLFRRLLIVDEPVLDDLITRFVDEILMPVFSAPRSSPS